MRFTRNTLSLLCTFLIILFTATITVKGLWKGDDGRGWEQTIRSDARGYYGYLTSILIRNDLGNEPFAWEYVHRTPTGTLNKYFSGTAIMMAPWFAIGHGLALNDPRSPRNGYSEYEMKAIAVGGWVYLLLGLLALRALLLGLSIRDEVVAWIIIALGAGSTLLQYSALQPGWSHIYSFCTISVFFYVIHQVQKGGSYWWMLAAAALLGLIVVIRPVNALVVLGIPVVLGKATWPLIGNFLRHWYIVICAVVVCIAVIFIQPLLWYAQTGNWFEWGYRSEGFYWDSAEVLNVLFSFRRGLFLWTPIFLLAAASIFLLWRTDRIRSTWALIYWAANIYVISSWWIWYYGSGFGSRVFVEHYPIMVIPMAIILDRVSRKWWLTARLFFTICIALHLVQFHQYHMEILHHERMDPRKYAYTFLKFDPAFIGVLGGKYEVPPYAPNGMDPVLQAATDLERQSHHWREGRIEHHPEAFSGSQVCTYSSKSEFGITFIAAPGELPTDRDLWLEVRLMRYETLAGASSSAVVITTVQRADGSFAFYDSFKLNHVPGTINNNWEPLEYRIPVPRLNKGEELRFYVWNIDRKAEFLLDDLFMRVWAVRPY